MEADCSDATLCNHGYQSAAAARRWRSRVAESSTADELRCSCLSVCKSESLARPTCELSRPLMEKSTVRRLCDVILSTSSVTSRSAATLSAMMTVVCFSNSLHSPVTQSVWHILPERLNAARKLSSSWSRQWACVLGGACAQHKAT